MKKVYFTHISQWYSPKNRLEEAIHDYLRKEERQVVQADQLDVFKKRIADKIALIHTLYPRCHRITVAWSNVGNPVNRKYKFNDILLDLNHCSICMFYLYSGEVFP